MVAAFLVVEADESMWDVAVLAEEARSKEMDAGI